MSKIEVDAITEQSGSTLTAGGGAGKTVVVDATTVTLGRCGGTVALASGASQTGFGRTGTVDWQTTPKTGTFTAVSGEGYFANTTGSAFNMNLPAGVAGAIVSVADYGATFQTNNLTVVPNGTDKIGSLNENAILSTEGQSVTLVFVDSTQGWINTMDSTSNVRGVSPFINATGGTITEDGDFKIHTFTGPGTFTVCRVAISSPAPNNNTVSYIVVAGGGGGAGSNSAGGGAGGFRENKSPVDTYTASPLEGSTDIVVTAQAYPITVGSGGSARPNSSNTGDSGSVSTFSTVTSAGGGGGAASDNPSNRSGAAGGSGGGGGSITTGLPGSGGAGNTPPVSPAQGFPGGAGAGQCGVARSGGGGGGATAAGGNASFPTGGPGGAGAGTLINPATGESGPGPSRYYAGGGGSGCSPSPGGIGGGGDGRSEEGTVNTGGGGGATKNGGSGIVIIRYKFQ